MTRTSTIVTLAALAAGSAAGLAQAQTSVNGTNKRSWSENTGWMNWRDAGSPTGSQGMLLGNHVTSGFVWMENVGWLNLGDGTPADGFAYANTTGADFGLNIGADGAITGLAWGENIGWVNFTLPSLPAAQKPWYDFAGARFRGYAWGENIGWINLDSTEPGKYVGVRVCAADFNFDGFVDGFDYDDFVTAFETGDPNADFNNDGFLDGFDYDDYVTAFEAGC